MIGKSTSSSKIPVWPNWRAQGRLPVGVMNKTEKHLEQLKTEGAVLWFKFEGLKFRLANNTFYTPDFIVMRADYTLEAHEIKGIWTDIARVKILTAAALYPIKFFGITLLKGGRWESEEFKAYE